MDDIKTAAKHRFERAIQGANWQAQVQGDPANTVAFWLYSVNPVQGARLIVQLSVEGYREACSPAGFPREPGITPADVLGGFLGEYDLIEDLQPRLEKHKELAAALLYYASSTRTWGVLPPLGDVPGIHMVISDWSTVSSGRVFRPCAKISPSVLSPEILADLLGEMIEIHVARNPAEYPVLPKLSRTGC
ncbi:hypothetical protein [Pseudomonas aeruginosa]|uniref:hypothetical protein n=1 Tax=Pseudomonas aeruginosa TaxID=287 RepID=UPI002E29BC4C|nr:hypothetical protein [Pseudomonas aeruginosa]